MTVGRIGEDELVVDLNSFLRLAVSGEGAAAWLRRAHGELRWPAEEGLVHLLVIDPPDDLPGAVGQEWDALAEVPFDPIPVVALAWSEPPPDVCDAVVAIVHLGLPRPGDWHLEISGATAVLEPLGLEMASVPAEDPRPSAPAGLRVAVLGPVEVTAGGTPLLGRVAELLAYLALHPEGVSGPALRTALWPEHRTHPGTLNNLVAKARKELADAGCAAQVIHTPERGRYFLTGEVEADVATLLAVVETGRRAGWPSVSEGLAGALALVRGRPFDGWEDRVWVDEEGHLADVAAAIAAAAQASVRQAVANGDESARWHALRCLAAVGDRSRLDDVG